ncbi:hypothetical protein GCM10009864_01380 [Streptomyces lunalinharesii]|uniref:Uncharacterized protein n=1 Tax=Streptomyces lunalinharesii TaxID=333384 RepID=A0ABP6DK81_9ACTN
MAALSFAATGRPLALTGFTTADACAAGAAALLGAAVMASAAAQLAEATSAAEILCVRVRRAVRGREKWGMGMRR